MKDNFWNTSTVWYNSTVKIQNFDPQHKETMHLLRIIYPLLQLLFVEKKKIRYGPKKNFEYKSQRKSLDPEEKSLDPEEKVRILKKKFGSGRKSSDLEEKV